jgi:hypothetical protein
MSHRSMSLNRPKQAVLSTETPETYMGLSATKRLASRKVYEMTWCRLRTKSSSHVTVCGRSHRVMSPVQLPHHKLPGSAQAAGSQMQRWATTCLLHSSASKALSGSFVSSSRHGVGCIHDLVQQSQKQDAPGPGQYDVDAVGGDSRSERHSNSPPLSCGDHSLRDGHFAHD